MIPNCCIKDGHRYYLIEHIGNKYNSILIVIQKNTSDADDIKSDSTAGKVINWAKKNNFDKIIFLNLFSVITSKSSNLKECNLYNEETDKWIEYFLNEYPSATIIAAWGNKPKNLNEEIYRKRIQQVITIIGRNRLKIVGTITKNGYPRHGLSWNRNPKINDYSQID